MNGRCPITKRLWTLGMLAIVGMLAMSGCQRGPKRVSLFPATGEVRVGNQPAAGVAVVLHPAADAAPEMARLRPHGTTDASGRFKLSTYVADDGAPAGQWIVTLTWPDNRLPENQREQILASGDALPDRFRGRLASPERSTWQVTIQAGENNLPPILVPSF
jgi:hypothetical protein